MKVRLRDFLSCKLETAGVFVSIFGPNPKCLAVKYDPHTITAILALLVPDN